MAVYSRDDKAEARKNFVGQKYLLFCGNDFFLIKLGETDEPHFPNSLVGTEGYYSRAMAESIFAIKSGEVRIYYLQFSV